MAAEIRIYTIGDSWALMPSAFGSFVNNGNVNLYIQQQKGGAPAANDTGARIRPGGSFFVSHELYKITYLRTLAGTTTIANYEDKNNGAGTTSLIDSTTGNTVTINELGQMHTVMRGMVDAQNSSIVPLLANAEFVGAAKDTLDYVEICVSVFSDVSSAIDGLCIEFSSDGLYWPDDGGCMSIAAGKSKTFSFQPERKYYRMRYLNGVTNQGVFDLSTILRKTRAKPSAHNINKPIVGDDDAELVKSVITGLRNDGTFGNAILDNTNRQQVVSQPYLFSIAESTIPLHYGLFKFGVRTATAANTLSTIWEGPTALYPYMTTAQQLKVVSSSASDTLLGVGARTLFIQGLDANMVEISETINMTGITQVTTANSYLRVFRAYVATCGTSYTNVGAITVYNNAGAVVQLLIPATDGQTLMTMWTVPAANSLFITQVSRSTDTNKGARIALFTRVNDGGILYPWRIRHRAYIFAGEYSYIFQIPLKIEPKTDIELRVLTPASAGITSIGGTFEGWYESI